MPPVDLIALAFALLMMGSTALAGVGIVFAGPTRSVKIVTLVALVACVAFLARLFGPKALAVAAILPGSVVVGALFASRVWRGPFAPRYTAVAVDEIPAHAQARFEAWTAELRALGFSTWKDVRSTWRFGSEERRAFTRFLVHPDHRAWATLGALENPVSVSRSFGSASADGAAVVTADVPQDSEMFRDALMEVGHVSRTASCADMLSKHLDHVARRQRVGFAPLRVEDPIESCQRSRAAWVERMLVSGQLVRDGDEWLAIPLRQVPRIVVTLLRSWFQ